MFPPNSHDLPITSKWVPKVFIYCGLDIDPTPIKTRGFWIQK